MQLTSISLVFWIRTKFDIYKVDFEFLVRLYTNENWRTASATDDLIWEMDRLEDKSECSFLFHEMKFKWGK